MTLQTISTYSIVATDPSTGEIGSGIASFSLAVGSKVPHFGQAGLVHTQHHASPQLAKKVLSALEYTNEIQNTLDLVLSQDEAPGVRQVLYISEKGLGAAYTGDSCAKVADHRIGQYCVVGGNTLGSATVTDSIIYAFESSYGQELASRILTALSAGEKAGGDKRGRRSASLSIACPSQPTKWYMYPDLRVDEHCEPVVELNRIYEVFRAMRTNWS